jgi:hypothetical protein
MADTAQGDSPAETAPASREDQLASAAEAFKVQLGQVEAPERPRDDSGRFTSSQAEPEEIEAEAGAVEAEEAAESHEEGQDESEAADEAQHKDPTMPESWPADKAEVWNSLEPDAQDFIRQRDIELKSATNAKFMEAANLRKAHEAEIIEARTTRQQAVQAADLALTAIQPREPSISMLDINSSDYDPDNYHLAKAQYEQGLSFLQSIAAQRQNLIAQEQQEQQRQAAQYLHQINEKTAPAFVKDVPDAANPAKLPGVLNGLSKYLIDQGAPHDIFDGSETALMWHLTWKAREYDKLQSAKAKVQTDPRPEPRKAGPAVRPGVATPPSAKAAARRQNAIGEVKRSGTIEAGAAAWKHFLK